ncbi:putative dihydrofolate reductase [Arthrobacter sp. PAMC 25486]|uniref:dihydrofolate reductase family protein n=1 Tax=Arthrobacter sp. PAMC 25486 TaxID=1494608 RepID=UPI000536280B|nr:dihydrofolate reductase family protein [Arthrobacter sp. PAMC 25486]AIY01943.1 putative dihydrofolate reductase [Arthrobacter sp. PAMC 25486]
MAKLIYTALTSLDGYINDSDGSFDWAMPDDEVHAFANDLEQGIGTHLYGRRLYETMMVWEEFYARTDLIKVVRDYADAWHQIDKVVFSRTLEKPATERTRIERKFEPEAILRMKAESVHNLSVGGAELGGQALTAGLVDEIHLLVSPVLVGGGSRALPDGISTSLELLDQRNFGNGVVHLHYAVNNPTVKN